MQWQVIVALVIAIPIVLFPVLFVWYLNIGSTHAAVRRALENRAIRKKGAKVSVETK